MQANKNPEYQIKECDAGFHHVRVNQRANNPVSKSYEDNFRTIIFRSKKEFDGFNDNKHVLGLDGEELIHDPNYQNPENEAEKGSDIEQEKPKAPSARPKKERITN